MDNPMEDYKCPVYKHCKNHGGLFSCTYARKKGKPFPFTPACFKDKRRKKEGDVVEPTPIEEKKDTSVIDKIVNETAKTTNIIAVVNKSNIWDDIDLTTLPRHI